MIIDLTRELRDAILDDCYDEGRHLTLILYLLHHYQAKEIPKYEWIGADLKAKPTISFQNPKLFTLFKLKYGEYL